MRLRALDWFFTGGFVCVVCLAIALGLLLRHIVAGEEQKAPVPAAAPQEAEAKPLAAAEERTQTAPPAGEPSVKEQPKEEALVWDRPRFQERKEERLRMVKSQIEQRGVKDEAVLEAMRQVPRHLFVPDHLQKEAYADNPLPIGYGQTISQPYIVALMTELLGLKPGSKVLEIGTGSGYQAAVLAELTPHVYTIEIIRALAEKGRERLQKLGYKTVQTKEDDGYYGWKEHAPFDAIIVTAAAGHVPPPLVEQLKPGGKMAIPLGGVYETQQLVVVSKDEEGTIRTRSVLPVAFVPMTGRVQKAE